MCRGCLSLLLANLRSREFDCTGVLAVDLCCKAAKEVHFRAFYRFELIGRLAHLGQAFPLIRQFLLD